MSSSRRAARDGALRQGEAARAAATPAALRPADTSRLGLAQQGKQICVARIGAAHGTSGEVRLWPFTAAVVPTVDIAAGRIVIDPPAEIEAESADPQTGGRPA